MDVGAFILVMPGCFADYIKNQNMPKVSYFAKVFDKQPASEIEFDEYLSGIKHGKWQDEVLAYRTGKIKKSALPAITPSGLFTSRNYSDLREHSGILNIDIDQKDNPDDVLLEMRDQIYADPYVVAGHISVSGASLSVYVRINPKKHYESFCAIEKYFSNTHSLAIDKAAKDIPRLRFVSLDPDLYTNPSAKKWTEYLEKEKQPPVNFADFITSDSDFDHVVSQIISKRANIAEDYHDWIQVGMSLAAGMGEAGRNHFHAVSSISDKYDRAASDRKYDSFLRSSRSGYTLRSFFWLAKRAGISIKSERTARIESVTRLRMKQVGKSGGYRDKDEAKQAARTYLEEVEQITGEDVDQVVDQVAELRPGELSQKKTDLQTKIDVCMQIINGAGVVLNIITGKLEADNRQLNDADINSLFLDAAEAEPTINKDLFQTVIGSNRVRKIDPFLTFIEKNKHLRPKGNIKKILDCINDRMEVNGAIIHDYKNIFVRKWLLSTMASIHGTYSLMILVLTGQQMIQKTNWFRWLLPDELKMYYAESKLDAGKDDEILMTQKLIIVDDEFGGKSKQEAKKLKDLSSKQYFSIRRPYARYPEDIRRIAVLGGTSNEDDILNDPTGNRRIIPLKVEAIDMEKYHAVDKTELFIELYHEWKRIGDGWMLTPAEVKALNLATVQHEQDVSEYQLIAKYFTKDPTYMFRVTTTDIKVKLENQTQQRLSPYKIGQSLRKLGYQRKSLRDGATVQAIWDIVETEGEYYNNSSENSL
jgi:hypothetical protein